MVFSQQYEKGWEVNGKHGTLLAQGVEGWKIGSAPTRIKWAPLHFIELGYVISGTTVLVLVVMAIWGDRIVNALRRRSQHVESASSG